MGSPRPRGGECAVRAAPILCSVLAGAGWVVAAVPVAVAHAPLFGIGIWNEPSDWFGRRSRWASRRSSSRRRCAGRHPSAAVGGEARRRLARDRRRPGSARGGFVSRLGSSDPARRAPRRSGPPYSGARAPVRGRGPRRAHPRPHSRRIRSLRRSAASSTPYFQRCATSSKLGFARCGRARRLALLAQHWAMAVATRLFDAILRADGAAGGERARLPRRCASRRCCTTWGTRAVPHERAPARAARRAGVARFRATGRTRDAPRT